jgi:ribosome maturation factor RimP
MGVCPFFVGSKKVRLRPKVVNRKETQIETLLAPVVGLEDCRIWGVEYRSQGKHSKLLLFIDRDDGVSVEHCERVSRRVSDVLEVEEVLSGSYTLEVSSPGMDRILFKPAQYEDCVGEEIEVRLNYPVEGSKRIKGVLVGLEDGEAVVRVNEDEFLLPLENVQRARVVPRFD